MEHHRVNWWTRDNPNSVAELWGPQSYTSWKHPKNFSN
jgi:hypothetical protein